MSTKIRGNENIYITYCESSRKSWENELATRKIQGESTQKSSGGM